MSSRRTISNTFTVTTMEEPVAGPRGKIGRFFYYAGAWNDFASTDSFLVNDAQAPYFAYNSNYWVFNPETNGTYTKQNMGTPSSSSLNWKLMTSDFKYIITEAIFGNYAHFGSFIINGDWMISQHGVIYDASGGVHTIDDSSTYGGYNSSNAYTLFDSDYPNSSKPNANNFVPNYAVDGKTGYTYQNAAYVSGEIHASSGKIGGFSIGAKELTNDVWQAGIDIEADSKVVRIGENAKGAINTENAIIRAENTKSGQQYNTALYLNAQNATYNYAFYGNGNGVLNGLIFGYKVNAFSVTGATDYTYYLDIKNGATVVFTGNRTSGTASVYVPKLSEIRKALGITSSRTPFAFEYALSNQTTGAGTIKLIFRSTSSSNTEYPYRTNFDNNYTGNNYELPMATGDYAKILLIWDGSTYKAFVIRYIDGGWGV